MRRLLIGLVGLALVAVLGWFAYQRVWLPRQTAVDESQVETTKVIRGTIASTVSATGSIEPADESSLSFRTPGIVDQVYIDEGQLVVEGQLLAELDTVDLTLAVAQAKTTLEINRAQLAKLLKPPSENDVAAAQAAVEVAQTGVAGSEASLASAQAAYRQLLAGSTEEERTVNRAQVMQAEAELRRAQQAYDEVRNLPNIGTLPQATQLEQATQALEVAQAQAALTDQPADRAEVASALNQIAQGEVSLRQAQSNLITAQNNLQTLLEGPDEEDVRVAQAQVQQAQLNQLQAENNLRNAQLAATLTGVVSQLNVKANEQAPTGLPALVLTDLSYFRMTVLVDEIDVRQLAVGQPVRIRVDALPDADIYGVVATISPTAQDVGGVTAYAVTVEPEPVDAPLRAGMSATAIITTAEVNDVILLANRFIQRDRDSGRAFVYKMVDGEPVLQEVTLGLRNERESQILSGLDDGDEVALVTRSSEEQLRGALFGGE
jgi:HlyD family secretion protein